MSYNTLSTAKAIVGVDLPQVLLDEAHAIVNGYTDYRWKTVSEVATLSTNPLQNEYMLRYPILSIVSVVLDGITLVADVDYEVNTIHGIFRLYAVPTIGYDNLVITYTWGNGQSNESYAAVLGAEARIALYLKRNPLMLRGMGTEGIDLGFADDHIATLLSKVPRGGSAYFTAV